MKQPTKAIITAAGLGTRFLPQTKAMPKEMLPIMDKPIIQHIVEEAVSAGVTDIIVVTGSHKRSVEDHFDRSYDLEERLIEKGKEDKAEEIRAIAELANFVYIRQKGPYGNAIPILNAAHLLSKDEPFFVFFPDDFFRSEVPRAQQLLDAFNQEQSSIISLFEVDKNDSDRYGMAKLKQSLDNDVHQIEQLVEKPGPDKTPSNFASSGCYLLTPEIMPILEERLEDSGGEVALPVAINKLAQQAKVCGKVIDGIYHDTGSPQLYLEAIVDTALADPGMGEKFRQYLEQRLGK